MFPITEMGCKYGEGSRCFDASSAHFIWQRGNGSQSEWVTTSGLE